MARTRFGGAALVLPVVIACGMVVGLAAEVRAQPSSGTTLSQSGHGRGTSSRMDRYAKVLGLDEAQTEALKDLNEAYQKDAAAAGKKMRSLMQDAQDHMNGGDRAAFEKGVQKSMAEQRETTARLTEKFLADVKSILRTDQVEKWPALERLRRREQYLSSMMSIGGIGVSGSSVDLIPIVGALKVPAEAKGKVDEVMGLYEVDMDRPLKERQQNTEDEQKRMGAVQHFEQAEFEKKLERDRKVDLVIREVNQKYLKQLATVLPEDLAKKLEENYQVRAFRNIYKTSNVAKKMNAAMKVEGLSEDQKRRLQAAMDAYKKDARAANDRWAAAQYRAETEGRPTGGGLLIGGPGWSGDKVDPDVADARTARRAVDDKARTDLEAILTAEQLAAIPKPEVQGGMIRTVSVFGDEMGDEVFIADMDMPEGEMPPEGGGVMIIRTVEGPGHSTEEVRVKKKAD